MLGTKNLCPDCGYTGDPKLVRPFNSPGFDPLMAVVKCPCCELIYEIAPPPWYKEGENKCPI